MRSPLVYQHQRGEIQHFGALDADAPEQKITTWERYAGWPDLPRRLPWQAYGQYADSATPVGDDMQVVLTPRNIGFWLPRVEAMTGNSITSGSALNNVDINQIVKAVIDALPVVDFRCP